MRDDARKRVAANVRAELARSGRNGADLARFMHTTRQGASLRLTGRQAFKAEEIAAIAAWLGVSPSLLLDVGPQPARRVA